MPSDAFSLTHAETERGARLESDDPVVSVRGLQKAYGRGSNAVVAVDDVSFDVERGSVVGLLGPNGAGKTTVIKMMLGLVIPDAGRVEVAGVDVSARPSEAYGHVGAMLEGARNVYWRLTVRENLAFFTALGGRSPRAMRERHERLLTQLGLESKADTPVKDLSRGQKQRASLACTLAREAAVVFLDEPTLGLDVESSRDLRRELRRLAEEEGVTVLLSSHDMDVIEDVCDRVVILNDGRVVADAAVAELLDLFRTQTYRFDLERPVHESVRHRLASRFGAGDWRDDGDRVSFEVTVDGQAFYALVDALREAGCDLRSVSSDEPDFEDVFVELTDRGDDDG